MKLGILVTKVRHLGHIADITEAAIGKGHEVTIFVMDEGTQLLRDRKFSDLAKLNRVSVSFCEHSAEMHGIDKTKLVEEIVPGSQFDNAMMNHSSDRVISLWLPFRVSRVIASDIDMIDVVEKSGTNGMTIRILHILSDGAPSLAEQTIKLQSKDYQVDVIDLSSEGVDYGELIDKIFTYDKVVSW